MDMEEEVSEDLQDMEAHLTVDQEDLYVVV